MTSKVPKRLFRICQNLFGATPSPETFDLEDREEIAFGYLHSFHKESESYIVNVSNRYRDGKMPDKVIPIADDVFGNKICFDFRKGLSSPFLLLFTVHKCM
ncbi:SMI1/KNR4 family protein [Bacillus spizizenii]